MNPNYAFLLSCLFLLAIVPNIYGQAQSIETMWRCGQCDQNDCKPATMFINQCTQICSPCTGACATEHYILKPNTATSYTLDQYSAAGCFSIQFSHFVDLDSCKTSATQCSRVYLPNSAFFPTPSFLIFLGVMILSLF